MKKLLGTTALAVLLSLSGMAQAVEFKMSHVRPEGATIDKELRAFGEEVATKTGGELTIRIFPANALGDSTAVQERISVGAIEMATQPAATGADRRMQIASFPYLAANWEEAKKIYGPEGILHSTMTELYAEQGITMLAAYPVYFGGISLNKPNPKAGSLEPNGIKIRVPGIKSFQLTGEALGYIPAPVPFAEAFTAIQTGAVDGAIGSGAEGYYSSFRDVTKQYIPANTHFEVWFMIVNTESFNSLSPEEQDALKTAASDFEAKRWTVAQEDQGMWEQKLHDELGTEVVALTDEQLKAMADKAKEFIWPQIMEDVGQEWAQGILDKAKM